MAERLIAGIAANDLEQLEPLFSRIGWEELAGITRGGLRTLRARLDEEHIDLAAAKIVKVEATMGLQIEQVDITLDHRGRSFRIGFSALDKNGYHLLGFSNYIR